VQNVLESIDKNPDIAIVRFKNYFRDLDTSHYRRIAINVKINVDIDGKTVSHVAELQINLKGGEEVDNHKEYEYFRAAGDTKTVMAVLKRQMDTMHEIVQTPVLLALFCCSNKFEGGKRPELPQSLHGFYLHALTTELPSEGVVELYQAIAFENFIHENRREFTAKNVLEAKKKWNVNIKLSEEPRFIKVLEIDHASNEAVLMQFAHLSIQEALAGFHLKGQAIDAEHVFRPGAYNFLKICKPGVAKTLRGVGEKLTAKTFGNNKHLMERLSRIFHLGPSESFAALAELDLSSSNITGNSRFALFCKGWHGD
jgi:hypothetical protein